MVCVPPQSAFHEPINWYRTALRELGHWNGHASRLGLTVRGGAPSGRGPGDPMTAADGDGEPTPSLQ